MSKSKNLLLGLLSTAATMFSCGDKDGNEVIKPNPGPLPAVGVSVDIGDVTEVTTGAGMDPQNKSNTVAIFESFKFSSGADGVLSGGMYVSFVGHSPENIIVTHLGKSSSSSDFENFEVKPINPITMEIRSGTSPNFGSVKSKAGITQVFKDDEHMAVPHTHTIDTYTGRFVNGVKVSFDKFFNLNAGDVFSGTEQFQQLNTSNKMARYNFYFPQ